MSRADRREALLGLFAQESERRLGRMAAEALELDAGTDPERLAALFRDAHTVKGSAAVMGFEDLAELAHVVEDLLDELRQGRVAARPALVDALLAAVDDLRTLTRLGLEGAPTAELSAQGRARLRAALAAEEPVDGGARPEAAPRDEPPSAEAGAEEAEAGPGVDEAGPGADPAGLSPVEAPPTLALPDPRPVTEPVVPVRQREGLVVPVERLDELVRLVGEAASAQLRLGTVLAEHGLDPTSLTEHRDVTRWLGELQQQTMRARMVPVSTVVERLRRGVRDLARSCGKQVVWEVRGEDTELDRSLLDRLGEALLHLVRNAVDHGLETPEERRAAGKPPAGTVRLHAMQLGSEVVLTVTDDGRGLDLEALRRKAGASDAAAVRMSDDESAYLVFRSGLSTAATVSEVSGRGVGLDAVRHSLDAVRGRIEVHSTPGEGCEFRLVVPLTLAVLPSLLVRSGGQRYALPMHSIVTVLGPDAPTRTTEGVPTVRLGEAVVPVAALAEALGTGPVEAGPVVVLTGTTRRLGLRVQAVEGQREVVVKNLSPLVGTLECFTGASVEPDGSVLLVLDAAGTINRARARRAPAEAAPAAASAVLGRRASVLVVDDALTVRELQRAILQRAGYEVRTAGDGQEALALLAQQPADLVLTDVEMPVMDGFALTEAIRASDRLAGTAVVVLTSRTSEADRRRGLQAGADGYLVKSAFDEAALLAAVTRLLGGGAVTQPSVRVVLACPDDRRPALLDALRATPGVRVAAAVSAPGRVSAALADADPALLLVDDAVEGGAVALVRSVMSASPAPVLVLRGSRTDDAALLAAGAVEVRDREELAGLGERCQVLARVAVVRRPVRTPPVPVAGVRPGRAVLAVAASTGGPPALARLLSGLAGLPVPVLVVQHIADDFLPSLGTWLADTGPLPVSVASDGDAVRPGHVHLAPGGSHLRLRPGGRLELGAAPAGLHVPSADVLFASVAACPDVQGIGVLLTGMGRDGAAGLLALREAGGRTIAQDEATSTVYGMPRSAVELGAAELVLPLGDIAAAVRGLLAGVA